MEIGLEIKEEFSFEDVDVKLSIDNHLWNMHNDDMEEKFDNAGFSKNKRIQTAMSIADGGVMVRLLTTKTPSSEPIHHMYIDSLYHIGSLQKKADSDEVSVVFYGLGSFLCKNGKKAFSLINHVAYHKTAAIVTALAYSMESEKDPHKISMDDFSAHLEGNLRIEDHCLDGFENYFDETNTRKNSSRSR